MPRRGNGSIAAGGRPVWVAAGPRRPTPTPITASEEVMFKFLGGTVLAIFLIGLLVVIGLLALIF